MSALVTISRLSHHYGQRQALHELSFAVEKSQLFGLLGPNGSGKSTLFRLLSTLVPLRQGDVTIGGSSLRTDLPGVRRQLGVVFQSPSLDKKLTVRENLVHQGHLYGLSGPALATRCRELLERFALSDRATERIETLSGGLQRRVELAKALLHRPAILLLDEPSTGLDPLARRDLWSHLRTLQKEDGVTLLVTTHLMDEAAQCDRLAILDAGRLVAEDTPEALTRSLAGTLLTVRGSDPTALAAEIQAHLGGTPQVVGPDVRLDCASVPGTRPATEILSRINNLFGSRLQAITLSQPGLDDVFIARTGRHFDATPT